MDDLTIRTYNQLAREYDDETAGFWDEFPVEFIQSFIQSLPRLARVLNVGSGPGRDGSLLYAHGLNVICLDASPKMVEMCKERGLFSVQGDFLYLPFENNSFDGLWAYTALLHIKKAEISRALGELSRVLRSGGILVLGMIAGEGEGYQESSGVKAPRWFAYYSQEELEQLLKENGFEILKTESFSPRSKTYLNFLARKIL